MKPQLCIGHRVVTLSAAVGIRAKYDMTEYKYIYIHRFLLTVCHESVMSLCACMCADIPLARECMFRLFGGLMRALSIWGCVGGRLVPFVLVCVTCSHKTVLT